MEQTAECPRCDKKQPFKLAARTTVSAGEKRKLACPDCGYKLVRITDTA